MHPHLCVLPIGYPSSFSDERCAHT
jgi:hypothetical protein